MKTAMLLAAAIFAAGASAQAQTNVVISVTNNNFYLLGNPLNASPNNVISNVIPIHNGDFDSCTVYLYRNGMITPAETYIGLDQSTGYWYPGTNILNPGTGFFFYAQLGAFSGVPTNSITFNGTFVTNGVVILPPGFSLVSSPFAASLTLQGLQCGYPFAQDSDVIYRYNTPYGPPYTLNDLITYVGELGWYDGGKAGGGSTNGPVLNLAEGFYYYNATTYNHGVPNEIWTQNFYVP